MSDKDKKIADKSKDIDYKALSGMTAEFGDVFQEIKSDKSDTSTQKAAVNSEESAIRGIFGRIKKKSEQSSAHAVPSEPTKKITSMNLSDSQEILDISREVNIQSQTDKIVVVTSEEKGSDGMTTITMQIPKLTDDELTRIKRSEKQKHFEGPQSDKSDTTLEQKSYHMPAKNPEITEKSEAQSSQSKRQSKAGNEPDMIENTDDIFKKTSPEEKLPPDTVEKKEVTHTPREDGYSESVSSVTEYSLNNANNDSEQPTTFKGKLSRFFSIAKEKAMYYLGFGEDDDFEDENIYSTSGEIERYKNANPLDFDEEYKENIVYQASEEDKKEKEPDLLKVAAQNTEIAGLDTIEAKESMPAANEKPKSAASEITQDKSEKKQRKTISSADLTLDEIIAAEKMSDHIDIEISQEDNNTHKNDSSNNDADFSISSQLDFSVLSEQVAGDVLEPQASKISKEIKTKNTSEVVKTVKPKTPAVIAVEEATAENANDVAEKLTAETPVMAVEEANAENAADVAEKVTAETPVMAVEEATAENADNVTEKVTAETPVMAVEEATAENGDVAEKVTAETPVMAVEEATAENAADVAEKVTAETPVMAVEEATAENADNVAEKVTAETPVMAVEEATAENGDVAEKLTTETPVMAVEEATAENDNVAEKVTAETPVMVVEEATAENADDVTEKVTAETPVMAVEEATAENADNVAEKVTAETPVMAVEEATAENADDVAEKVTAETPVMAVEEATAENADDVAEKVTAETPVMAVEEATTEKVEEEFKSDKENIIKIVDKSTDTKVKKPAENEEQFTEPTIITKEKETTEYRTDFEKGYDEIPKTLLIYKRSTDKDNFIVMAGKFTRTVRSEYRAYRFRPNQSESAPQKPTESSGINNADNANDNPFVTDVVLGNQRKKSNAANKPAEKRLREKTPPVRKKTSQRTNSQSVEASETPVNAPNAVVKPHPVVSKPTLPKIPVPSIMHKKQTPQIMPEIKPQEEINEARNEEKPKQKSKNQSAARAAIKKEAKKLKLFSDDEGDTSEEAETASEKREIEEYRNRDEEKEIKSELSANYHKLTVRLAVVSIVLFLSIVLDILTAVMSETFLNMTFGWLLVAFINAAVLAVAVSACYIPITNGIVPLKGFKGNSDTGVAFAAFAGIIQSFVSFFSPDSFIDGTFHYYTTLVILALLINCIGRMMIVTRVRENFKFITMNRELYAGKIYTDEKNAKKMYSGAPLNKPLIAYRKKTHFLSDFLRLSYAPDPSENIAAKIAPYTSAISLICAIIYAIIGGGVAQGASAFALFAVILTPVCELIAVNLPIKKLCSAVLARGSMVTSFESVKQFCDTNAIIIDSADLYPSGTVTMSGIKTFSGSKVDDAIRGAAAVMLAVKAPMSNMFENIVQGKRDTLPHVESVIYEDGLGLVGWVSGQRILLGNRRLLDAHGIKIPSADYEKKFTSANKQAVYLSLGGELVAMFVVNYRGDRRIAEELRSLEQNGVAILIRTIDSNITQDRIAEDFGVYYRTVKILPTGLGNITKEMTDTPDEETRAYIATKGDIKSLARAISGCIRIKSNVTLSIVIQMFSIILGFILVGTITFVSGVTRLNILELLIYYAFWIAVTIIAPAVRKP